MEKPPSVIGTAPTRGRTAVVIAGIGTSVLALVGVYLSNTHFDFNVMGLYANYVIPAGAILVGCVASSGYGAMSWFRGVKISQGFLMLILALQVIVYAAAQYVEFVTLGLTYDDGTPVDFLTYYDYAARSFAWISRDGEVGEPMGPWGYAFRLLEVIGFCGGSLVVPALLRSRLYCDSCALYMRERQTQFLAASVPERHFWQRGGPSKHERAEEGERLSAVALEVTKRLAEFAERDDRAAFRDVLVECRGDQKQIRKLPVRLSVSLSSCPSCTAGIFVTSILRQQGQVARAEPLAKQMLPPRFVDDVTRPRLA